MLKTSLKVLLIAAGLFIFALLTACTEDNQAVAVQENLITPSGI